MKKIIAIILSSTAILYAANFSILWIGNSLTQGSPSWCQMGEGYEWTTQVMVNYYASDIGMKLWSAAIIRGATDLDGHWQQDVTAGEGPETGIGELRNPTGYRHFNGMAKWMDSLDHYHYVMLQGYKWDPPYTEEIDYTSRYIDLALENGVTPIIFACWQDPTNADGAIGAYDSLYRKYKSRGAMLCPVFQAHRLSWADPSKDPQTYLYNAGDAYHHENRIGAYLNACVFYEIFTGRSPVGIKMADLLPACSDLNTMFTQADMDYCAQKAHQAVVNYYGAGNAPSIFGRSVHAIRPVKNMASSNQIHGLKEQAFDLTGKRLGAHSVSGSKAGVVVIRGSDKNVRVHVIQGQ